jgi:hypothetical protein
LVIYLRRRNSMFRALFRRLPLAASLVVLLSVSLSSVVFAKAQATGQTCAKNPYSTTLCDHLYVAASVTAPNGGTADTETEGAFGVVGQYHPKVGQTDAESLAQIDIFDGTHFVEVGWVSLPGSTSSVIFVATRDNDTLCVVQPLKGGSTGWTCGFTAFGSFNTTHYYPGSTVPSDGTPASLYLLNTGTDIYIQYGNDWLGKITNTFWLSGSFGPVTLAHWQGEVEVNKATESATRTEMGNGKCGSAPNSATISSMEWFIGQSGSGSFYPVNASSLTVTKPSFYNSGQFTGTALTMADPVFTIPHVSDSKRARGSHGMRNEIVAS